MLIIFETEGKLIKFIWRSHYKKNEGKSINSIEIEKIDTSKKY